MNRDDWKCVVLTAAVLLMVGFLFGFGAWAAWKIVGLL
jgi:hypothetical protein